MNSRDSGEGSICILKECNVISRGGFNCDFSSPVIVASCGTCPYILLGGPRCFGDLSLLGFRLQRSCVSAYGVRILRNLYHSSLLTVFCPGIRKLVIQEKIIYSVLAFCVNLEFSDLFQPVWVHLLR